MKDKMGSSSVTLWSKPGERVRKFIKDSEDQLAAWAPKVPKVVVICDLRHHLEGYPTHARYGFGDWDFEAGMFGETVFRLRVYDDRITHDGPERGGRRTLRHDQYTHIS